MPIRILLYDDNEALRNSMQVLLEDESDLELIAAMPNAETITTDIASFKPDVILMDIDMPALNGVEAIKLVRKKDSQLPVIMLTVFEDNENIFNAVCAGASGYILKRYATDEITDAIRDVLKGGAPMTGSVARKVLLMVPRAESINEEKNNLSERETEILQLLVKGYSYKMISSETNISIDTVRFHLKKIYLKLQVHSATEAVSKAIKDRLIN